MYLLFCTDFYIFRNFVFFVFLVVQYRRSVICKIKRLDTNTRDFGYIGCTLPDKTNNNQCRLMRTFRQLDQRDPLRLLPKDHEVEALAEAACIYSRVDSPRMLDIF